MTSDQTQSDIATVTSEAAAKIMNREGDGIDWSLTVLIPSLTADFVISFVLCLQLSSVICLLLMFYSFARMFAGLDQHNYIKSTLNAFSHVPRSVSATAINDTSSPLDPTCQ